MVKNHDTVIRNLHAAQLPRSLGEEKARNEILQIDEKDERKEENLQNPELHGQMHDQRVQFLQRKNGEKMERNHDSLVLAHLEAMLRRESGERKTTNHWL